jgi:acyl dehydratase
LFFPLTESRTPANRDTVLLRTAGAIYAALRASTQGDFMNASNERMSVFGPTLRFKGELKAQEDIKIEGRIEGTIHHQQRVIVGAKGEVVATIERTVMAFRELDWKFSRPVMIGDTIRVNLEVTETKPMPRLGGGTVTMKVTVLNQNNEVVNRGNWVMLVESEQ